MLLPGLPSIDTLNGQIRILDRLAAPASAEDHLFKRPSFQLGYVQAPTFGLVLVARAACQQTETQYSTLGVLPMKVRPVRSGLPRGWMSVPSATVSLQA